MDFKVLCCDKLATMEKEDLYMLLGNRESTSKLFSNSVQYKVPHYQRRYVWDKTNWRTLWEDILAQLGLELEESTDGKYAFKTLEQCEETSTFLPGGGRKKHFTGIIVIRQISREEPEIFEVIDGQQRLTTFQIIFCVIRDIFKLLDKSFEAWEPQNLIINQSSNDESDKFIPTDYDQSAFKKIVLGNYGNLVSQSNLTFDDEFQKNVRLQLFSEFDEGSHNIKVSHDILNVYNYFYKWIWDYVQKNEDDKKTIDTEKLGTLLSKIKTQFDFVKLIVDEEDNSEEIFESLNATGRKLSDFDYLRNNLFLRAGKLGDHHESGKSYSQFFYDKYWHFEKDEQTSHYWQTDKQEEFLRVFLIANLGPFCFSAENEKPYDVYRKYSTTVENVKNEFKQLSAYAKSYRELDNNVKHSNEPIYRYVQLCNDLSLLRLDPLILYVKHNHRDSVVNRVCEILESYLVRRMLCFGDKQDTYADVNNASYTRINYFFSKAVKEGNFNVDDFMQFLSNTEKLSFESEAAIWPDDTQIEDTLKHVGTKDLGFISYIFKRLEHYSQKEIYSPWEYLPPTLNEQKISLQQLQEDGIFANFNSLWESPPK